MGVNPLTVNVAWLIDQVKISRTTRQEIGHIRNVPPNQPLGLVVETEYKKTKQYNNKNL